MDEATSRFWTTIFGGITAMGLIAGGIYSVVQYFNTKQADQRNFQLEAQKPFLSKRLELCEEASSAAAMLATSDDKDERKKAEATFWRLYWGPLGIVEDQAVESAMVRFGDCIQEGCQRSEAESRALQLAHECRKEVSDIWGIRLQDLQARPKRQSDQ